MKVIEFLGVQVFVGDPVNDGEVVGVRVRVCVGVGDAVRLMVGL